MVTNKHDFFGSMSERITLPDHVEEALIADGVATIELRVKVTKPATIRAYGFSYDGWPVPMRSGIGAFVVKPGEEKLLEWVMIGDGGSTMKVEVTRDGNKIAVRETSKILSNYSKGYDALEIKVDADA